MPPLVLPGEGVPVKGMRLKTWQISPHYHCSIIGTCLTTGELRQLLVKLGEPEARAAGDHALHARGVRLAGEEGTAGKLLNKALDRRHDAIIKRMSKLGDADELRRFWREAYDRGDISGAYWALLSHPATDEKLKRDVFGDVHMLSHLVGSASRLDIARLTDLQRTVEEKDEMIARLERRLEKTGSERDEMRREIARLQEAVIQAGAASAAAEAASRRKASAPSEEAPRSGELAQKLGEVREELRRQQARAEEAEANAAELQRENETLERLLSSEDAADEGAGVKVRGAAEGAILYVGGRRSLYDKLRALADVHGVTLLLHDGGMEDSTTLLPAVLAQAETVLFPVDHISHTAAGIIKRACRESGKSYQPLRSSGISSFVAAIGARG
ncbi:hypothetical protein SAMN03159496_03921 [Rhizobium sp. NFR07]|nr:hypothetical protein SAMN03159496_03921 [Rhizobium sp. NFR07]